MVTLMLKPERLLQAAQVPWIPEMMVSYWIIVIYPRDTDNAPKLFDPHPSRTALGLDFARGKHAGDAPYAGMVPWQL